MTPPKTTSSVDTCEALAHSTQDPDLTEGALSVLDELEERLRTMMRLAQETAAYQRTLESRCAGYRTVIQELQKELAMYRPPSEDEQLQSLLNEYGI
jgi:hypothetical protein